MSIPTPQADPLQPPLLLPWIFPTPVVALSPPPVPPRLESWAPYTTDAADARAADHGLTGSRRRSLISMFTSLIVHVVVLTLLGLMVATTDPVARAIPITLTPVEEDRSDFEPMLDIVVDTLEFAEVPAEPEIVLAVADDTVTVEAELVETAMAAEVPADDLFAGGAEAMEGLLANLALPGSGGGAGGFGGGFGGDVGKRLARAGARTGAIQVSLSWDNFNDIDLHVVTPRGERIYFAQRRSSCGGHLDVDMNAGGPMTREAVENVYWARNLAPVGEFTIFVHHFSQHDSIDATNFRVHLLVDGRKQVFSGTVSSADALAQVTTFRRRPRGAQPPADEFAE